jgi:hypothetical protein
MISLLLLSSSLSAYSPGLASLDLRAFHSHIGRILGIGFDGRGRDSMGLGSFVVVLH